MKADFINVSEFRKIIRALDHPYDLVISVCLETGARVGDVVALPYSALSNRSITYTAQKTGKQSTAKLSGKLYTLLACYSDGVWLFPSKKSKSGHITRQSVWGRLRKTSSELGINHHVSPHSARKTFAVELLHKRGLNAVQKALQHDSVGTTALYCFSDIMQRDNTHTAGLDYDLLADIVAKKVVERLQSILTNLN